MAFVRSLDDIADEQAPRAVSTVPLEEQEDDTVAVKVAGRSSGRRRGHTARSWPSPVNADHDTKGNKMYPDCPITHVQEGRAAEVVAERTHPQPQGAPPMRLLATLVILSLVACTTEPQVIVVTATPERVPAPRLTEPTSTSVVVPSPAPTPAGITAAGVTLPPATATPIPTIPSRPTPTVAVPTPALAPELTSGVDALVACLGGSREYWLSQGPPPLTDALVECLNQQLGGQ